MTIFPNKTEILGVRTSIYLFGGKQFNAQGSFKFLFYMFFGYAGSLLGYTGSLLLCRLSLIVASRGYSLVVVHRLLFAVVSLVVGAQIPGYVSFSSLARGLSSCGTWRVASFKTRGGWNPCPLHWQVDS